MGMMQDCLNKKVWAVVGATNDPKKYGYKIYKKLKDHGYTVYPVNPGYMDIEGDPCFTSLQDLPQNPDVINMVVNPRIGLSVVQEAADMGVFALWFQPGTFNGTIEEALKEKGLSYVQDCVLVALQ